MPSQMSPQEHHLMPPDTQEELDVTCVASGKIYLESDCVEIDGKWVSKAHLSELVSRYDDLESLSYQIFKAVDKTFEGEFDLPQFNANLKQMYRALIKLAVEANKMGGGK